MPVTSNGALSHPAATFDLLHVPGVGRLLRWRWGRLLFQLPLLLLAGLMIYDGLTGPQMAPRNVATVAVWVHYRGLVILALLVFGNLFCMSCPFALPRTVAHVLSAHGHRWPRVLRNKWMAIAVLVLFFWAYEALDLWASPWLTAWLIVGYFGAAFVLEAVFAESPFCKYVCPLGTFNFMASTLSPLQIRARRLETCRTCVGKECVAGSTQILGCGTELFVPQVKSNVDCVFCLDCARACPHDNVALAARPLLGELTSHSWPHRWDLAFLALVFAFAGLINAFGMVTPVYALEATLARWLNTSSEGLLLLLIIGFGTIVLPALLGLSAALVSRWLAARPARAPHAQGVLESPRATEPQQGTAGRSAAANGPTSARDDEPLRLVFSRYAPAVMPLAFAIWFAHYGFHFATGALTIVPVVQNFLLDHGITLLGVEPAWQLGPILPAEWLLPLETLAVVIGFAGSFYVANRVSVQAHRDSRVARLATLPWLILFLALALAALAVLTQPMEMRGLSLVVG